MRHPALVTLVTLLTLLTLAPALACGDVSICELHLGDLCGAGGAYRRVEIGVVDAARIDVDGDGVDEIAIVDGATLTIAWEDGRLKSLGDLGWPRRLALTDLDGDGRDDLVLASAEPPALRRLRSRGDGGFDEDEAVPLAADALAIAAADLSGDGRSELLAAHAGALTVVDGASREARAIPLGRAPVDLEIADLDDDGDLDVVVVDLEEGALTTLLGDGAGGLTESATLPIGPAADELALADVDGDGRLDAIVRARTYTAAWIAAGDGAGGFDLPVEIELEDAARERGLVAAEPGASGLASLIAPGEDGLWAWVVDGARALVGRSLLPTPDRATFVSDRLVGGDGFIANLHLVGGIQPIIRRSLPAPRRLGSRPLAVGDFDGDGRPDLATLDDHACTLQIALAIDGDDPAPTWLAGPSLETCPWTLQASDVSGDGIDDLVAAHPNAGLGVLLGDGLGAFAAAPLLELASATSPPLLLRGPERPLAAIVADGGAPTLVASDGDGVLEIVHVADIKVWQLRAGDLDGDGDDDLVGIDFEGHLYPFLREGDDLDALPSFDPSALVVWELGGIVPGLALDDLDDDGRAEAILFDGAQIAALADLDGPAPTLRLDHTLAEGSLSTKGLPRLADLDGDGLRDLVTMGYGQLTLVRRVDAGFADVALAVATPGPEALDLFDLGGDGRVEVLAATVDSVQLLETADVALPKAPLTVQLPQLSDYLPVQIDADPIFGDFNGDERIDAAFALGHTLTIAWGDDGRFRESSTRGWARGARMAAADLDGDGQDELLTTTVSLTETLRWDGAALLQDSERAWYHPTVGGQPGAADLDGDGIAEPLLVGRTREGPLAFVVSRLLPSGASEEVFQAPLDEDPSESTTCFFEASLQAGDLDGDGLDELVAHPGCGGVALLWNEGAGRLRPAPLVAEHAWIEGVGDLLAVQGSTLVRIPVYGRDLGAPASSHQGAGRLRGLGDCDGDGRPDLLAELFDDASKLVVRVSDSFVGVRVLSGVSARCVDVNDDGATDLVGLDRRGLWTRLGGGAR